jgi:uncharacterized phage protein (predicted DNA packaging)
LIISIDEAKEWLRIDHNDEVSTIDMLIHAAEAYLKNATGHTFDSTNHLAKLFCLVLVTDWYENRDMIGKTSDQIRPIINSILMQLTYGGDTS